MALQKFAARESFTWPNGAIGWRPGGPFDCVGPYAKVENCPIDGTSLRVTAYATGYPDTFFSVPAACMVRGRRVSGFFTHEDSQGGADAGCIFIPYDRFREWLKPGIAGRTSASESALMALKDVTREDARAIREAWRTMETGAGVEIDRILRTHGIEYLGLHRRTGEGVYYCNAGDIYAETVLFIGARLMVGCIGDMVERGAVRTYNSHSGGYE
jgi:hypothetical protein